MRVPDGFEITLFAAEPDIRKPIDLTFDERGRMIVVEAGGYPLGAPEGEAPGDAVKILEDLDGDGRADSFKTFADGLDIPDGKRADVLAAVKDLSVSKGGLVSDEEFVNLAQSLLT